MEPITSVAVDNRTEQHGALRRNWSLAKFPIIAELELVAMWGTKSTLIGQLIVSPLVYTALLAGGLRGIVDPYATGIAGVSYLTFVFPGLLGFHVINAYTRTIYRATVDRRWGLLAVKRLSGVGPLGYVLGLCVAPIIAFLVQASVLTPVAIGLGARSSIGEWLSAVLLGALFVCFWSGLGITITSTIRNYGQRDLIISLSMLPLTFSAPIFYALDHAPRYLQLLSRINPLAYQVNAMRGAFLGDFNSPSLLVAIALSLISIAMAARIIARGEPLAPER